MRQSDRQGFFFSFVISKLPGLLYFSRNCSLSTAQDKLYSLAVPASFSLDSVGGGLRHGLWLRKELLSTHNSLNAYETTECGSMQGKGQEKRGSI